MADESPKNERNAFAGIDEAGRPRYSWQLTSTALADIVKLRLPPGNVLPIIFIPGIMGSNLCSKSGSAVWLLNGVLKIPYNLAWSWSTKPESVRQAILHPDRTKVYDGGNVPFALAGTVSDRTEYRRRGWGQIAETSYHKFLIWLERTMNEAGYNPAEWADFSHEAVGPIPKPGAEKVEAKLFPGTLMRMNGLPDEAEAGVTVEPILSDDLLNRAKFRFPVYAFGYNWLDSNDKAGRLLEKRIAEVIEENSRGQFKCSQVILVTHSMGGLVARSCISRADISDKIAGVVHGVMPAVGAAVAYRRCKIGMYDESAVAGVIIGKDGRQVTAVFAQAPGALQLLPSQDYRKNWLKIKKENGESVLNVPVTDPYSEIYLEKDKWWGLVNSEWLSPDGGVPITWTTFERNIMMAKEFHARISGKYHSNTYIFYGGSAGGQASFETITWNLKAGYMPKKEKQMSEKDSVNVNHRDVQDSGDNPVYIGGETYIVKPTVAYSMTPLVKAYHTSYWEASCASQDGYGDGTVPVSSGAAPKKAGSKFIKEQFRLSGISHEAAYTDKIAKQVTQYAITKIAGKAAVS